RDPVPCRNALSLGVARGADRRGGDARRVRRLLHRRGGCARPRDRLLDARALADARLGADLRGGGAAERRPLRRAPLAVGDPAQARGGARPAAFGLPWALGRASAWAPPRVGAVR